MLKVYSAAPTQANVETTLVSNISSGYAALISSLEFCTPTAATVTIKLYDSNNGIAGLQTFTTTVANESIIIDSLKVIPTGYTLKVKSTATDSSFTAYGSYSINPA